MRPRKKNSKKYVSARCIQKWIKTAEDDDKKMSIDLFLVALI